MIAIKSLNSQDFSSIVIERNKSISYGSFALSIHMLRPFNTIIRYSSLIRLYDCVLLCLFNCHFVGEQLIFFNFVSCQLFKYVFFSPFYLWFCLHVSWYLFKFILAISLDLCHDFWSYTFCHGNHIIPVPPPFPSPPLPSSPPISSSSVFRLTRPNKSSHDARCHHLHCFVGLDPSHQCSFRWICRLESGLLFHFSPLLILAL